MRVLFVATGVAYALLGFSARLLVNYIDAPSLENSFRRSFIALILVSLLVGTAFGLWFKTAFPKGYANQHRFVRPFIFPLLFSVLAFAVNRGWLFTLNTWVPLRQEKVRMIVGNKRIQKNGKSSSFRVEMVNESDGNRFEFIVGKKKYGESQPGTTMEFDLKTGWFGILYGDRP